MPANIKVAILDDHQSIVDGYLYRLNKSEEIAVVATVAFGEELEPMLAEHAVDVLILDVSVPTAVKHSNPFPILHEIPKLLQLYPSLHILVISMHNQRTLIKAVMEAGASGYILKDDRDSIRDLDTIIRSIANGGIYLSQQAMQQVLKDVSPDLDLSARQLEVLYLCAAYPDESSAEIGRRLHINHSTVRNLLSSVYLKLDVRSRTAAVAKATKLGLIPPLDQAVPEPI